MKMNVKDIEAKVDCWNSKSAWQKGVKKYAQEIIQEYIYNGKWNGNIVSEGGSFLIDDQDIAERLCTKSELLHAIHKDGSLRQHANGKESWIDVQSRAVYQAICLISRIISGTEY